MYEPTLQVLPQSYSGGQEWSIDNPQASIVGQLPPSTVSFDFDPSSFSTIVIPTASDAVTSTEQPFWGHYQATTAPPGASQSQSFQPESLILSNTRPITDIDSVDAPAPDAHPNINTEDANALITAGVEQRSLGTHFSRMQISMHVDRNGSENQPGV